jgi:hypothetical protein
MMQAVPVRINYYRDNSSYFELFKMPYTTGMYFAWQKDYSGNLMNKLKILDSNEEKADQKFKQFIIDMVGYVETITDDELEDLGKAITNGQYKLAI